MLRLKKRAGRGGAAMALTAAWMAVKLGAAFLAPGVDGPTTAAVVRQIT